MGTEKTAKRRNLRLKMTEEEKIKQELEEKFGYLKDTIAIKRKGRIFADVSLEKFDEVFAYAVEQIHFDAISTITGMDTGDCFAVIYHLNRQGSIVLNIRVSVSKDNPAIKTVTRFFISAEMYEREIMDLLGIQVNGLADGRRYPLPDNWPKNEYPLRKDWKESTSKKEAQNA
jgi:Ni,Fe-hydrogenase III component G